jgi:short-subunit dehydrogenase
MSTTTSSRNQQTVLITGASMGIGYELAKVFARMGYALVLVARSTERLQALAASLPQTPCKVISLDLSLPNAPAALEQFLADTPIDILVNNAGFGDYGLFHERELNKQLQMIDLNIRSLTELTYRFGRKMVGRRSGKILNVASTAAFQPGPLMSVYYATKHYVLAFSEGLANEWQDFGVSVSALCPGPTRSGFQEAAQMSKAKIIQRIKMPSSLDVAEYAYRSLMNNKTVAVHGTLNRIASSAVSLIPRSWVVRIVRAIQNSGT